jgi:transposase
MRKPIFARPLEDDERKALEEGLRSSDAFVLRRCQILLQSSRGERASQIARSLGCNDQTVRNAIHAFGEGGLEQALNKGSSRPRTIHAAFFSTPERAERLRELLHRSPREFGKPTGLWTLDLAAEVGFEERITRGRVTGETVRATLERLGVRWMRAKRWIESPDPEYARKKGAATD